MTSAWTPWYSRPRVVASTKSLPDAFEIETCSLTTTRDHKANSRPTTVTTVSLPLVANGMSGDDESARSAPWRAPCGCTPPCHHPLMRVERVNPRRQPAA